MLIFAIVSCERDDSDTHEGPCELISAGTIKGDTSVSSGAPVTIITIEDTYPHLYRIIWQASNDGVNFTDIEEATNDRYYYSDIFTKTTWIRKRTKTRRITNNCPVLYTNAVKITVY